MPQHHSADKSLLNDRIETAPDDKRMTTLGVFQHGWWKSACDAAGLGALELPVATHASGNAYAADLASRLANGNAVEKMVEHHSQDAWLDNGGTGLAFLSDPRGGDRLDLLHERLQTPLISHFIDPLVTAFQGLDWGVVWQCLHSLHWIKAVWDRAQVRELQSWGVPHVFHLPMAAPDRPYDTTPLDHRRQQPIVSFVGAQNTSFFAAGAAAPTAALAPGVFAHAARADLTELTFFDVFYDLLGLSEPIRPSDNVQTQIRKSVDYFNAKLFYNAALCLKNRDRFVIFLKRKLGDLFRLAGRGWDSAYGLKTEPPFSTADQYFAHFREAAINVNLVNGNAESGLNMRHFEITAAGGFLLCYRQPELADHFEIGKECAVFDHEADLLDKIRYYLAHGEERATIARAGQARTLRENLYSHRLRTALQQFDALTTSRPDARTDAPCAANTARPLPQPQGAPV